MTFKMSASERWAQYKDDVIRYKNEVAHLRSNANTTDGLNDYIKGGIVAAGVWLVIIFLFAFGFFVFGVNTASERGPAFGTALILLIVCIIVGVCVIYLNMDVVNKSNKSFKDNDIQDVWDNNLDVIMADKLFSSDTDYKTVKDIQIRIK
jgi:hypothetical protein